MKASRTTAFLECSQFAALGQSFLQSRNTFENKLLGISMRFRTVKGAPRFASVSTVRSIGSDEVARGAVACCVKRLHAAENLADEQRAGSPQFHHWLTDDEYAEKFGAAPEDIATISAWLSAEG